MKNAAVISLALLSAVSGVAAECAKKAESPYVQKLLIGKDKSPSCQASRMPFKIGIARYTMWNTPFERVLDITEALDCGYLSLIEGTIARDASDAEIAAYKAKLASRGIVVDTLGPVYYDKAEIIESAFAFAKRYGMKMISVVPFEMRVINGKTQRVESDAMLDILEKLVAKYDIKAAIHNHGPETPYLFPTAESISKRIANRDARIGYCFDIGHQARFGGGDPVRFIRENAARIYDIHLKNIKVDPVQNLAKEGPRGELDIPGVMKALADIGYDGVCHIEYEKDHADNLVQLAESIGYYRGVMDAIKVKPKMQPAPEGANTLSAAEKAEGWSLAWDGKTFNGWLSAKSGFKSAPEKGWVIKDGTLTMRPVNGIADGKWFPLPPEDQKLGGGGDIVTAEKYRDFAFKFDFRLTEAANSGVKYFFDETQNKGTCEEYQILENGHPDSDKGVDGNRKSAALYDIIPAHADKLLKRVGEWNTGMIVAKGAHVEHWLNGVKVVEYDRGTPAFKNAVKKSKYATWGVSADGKAQDWGETAEGRILLQDHSDSTVSFCNLKIKKL